eukprot:4413004-Pyramimonas_sp.AAC.1
MGETGPEVNGSCPGPWGLPPRRALHPESISDSPGARGGPREPEDLEKPQNPFPSGPVSPMAWVFSSAQKIR